MHGWDGYPEEGWFPWLKKELEVRGFEVIVPQMIDAENPKIANWVPQLAGLVGSPNEQTYFVGHSMGCQAIARYLETLPEDIKVGGVVFVAGFFKQLSGAEDEPETLEVRNEWLNAPLDFGKVRSHILQSVAIFSDNDPWVPLDNQDDFKNKLGSKIVIEHSKGHFSGPTDKLTELPVVLEELSRIDLAD